MGWFGNKKEEKKAKWWQSRSKEERLENAVPGFNLTGGTELSIGRNKQIQKEINHLIVTEVRWLTEEQIENEYEVLGEDEDGKLIVRRRI